MFVTLCQVLDPQHGMHVWPCAVVLAQYLWSHREELRGKKVLEVSRSTVTANSVNKGQTKTRF